MTQTINLCVCQGVSGIITLRREVEYLVTVSDFSLKLIIIFLPGIVSFLIIDTLTIHKETKNIHRFIFSMILGFLSYGILKVICPKVMFWNYLGHSTLELHYEEIILAIIIGIILGVLITYIINKSCLYKSASIIGLTQKHGYPDTFSYMTALYTFDYITVTDWEKNIRLVGTLVATSDIADNRNEIVLQDVSVYTTTGEYLYDTPVFYIAQDFSKLTIEINNSENSKEE